MRGTLKRVGQDHRIDLAAVPLTQPIATPAGEYLLFNLDIALLDLERRQFVLTQLQSLLARSDVGV